MENTNNNETGAEATIPQSAIVNPQSNAPQSAMDSSAISNPQSELILAVEDSPIQAKLLERILLGAGYRVIAAKDGAEGLAMARREKPTAIISDINMPVMNGFEMCNAIKKDEALRQIPVILLTMLSETRDVIHGLNAGADCYINKPYDAERLLHRLRFVLGHPLPPPPPVERRKMAVILDGDVYPITASSSQQILNLLVYTYDNMVFQNRDLITTQDALNTLNENLEETVNERTAALRVEIAGRIEVQQALQESEEKFRQICATAQDAILMMDSAGLISYWNDAAQKIFGFAAEEALGRELHVLIVPERFREACLKNFPAFLATGTGAIIGRTLELAGVRKNGAEFPVELSVSAVKLKGRWQAVGFIHDISERKRAEANLKLFRELLEQSNDGIYIVDPVTSRFLDVNAAACRDLGYTREELLQRGVVDVQTSFHDIAGWQAHLSQLRPSGLPFFGFDALRKDGSRFPIEVSLREVSIEGKTYVVAVVRDITERKAAQRQLEQQLDELRRFRSVSLGREARMKELFEENEALRERLRKAGL